MRSLAREQLGTAVGHALPHDCPLLQDEVVLTLSWCGSLRAAISNLKLKLENAAWATSKEIP